MRDSNPDQVIGYTDWIFVDSSVFPRKFQDDTSIATGTAVAQWLRRCATNRKVAGSIPDGVIGIFHWNNRSDRTNRNEYQENILGVNAAGV